RSDALAGQKVNLEFVSANPTGPVHLGHTRWAAVGDSLRRLLAAAGAEVTSEYYINDAGSQMERFGRSVYVAAKGEPGRDDGTAGEHITDTAQRVLAARPDLRELPREEAEAICREEGSRLMLAEIKASLTRFGVEFDVWFSERTLHEGGAIEQ